LNRGLLTNEADESSTGSASFMMVDPDGNPVFIDQHVCRRLSLPAALADRAGFRC